MSIDSAMSVISQANTTKLEIAKKEDLKMCKELMELMKPEFDAALNKAVNKAVNEAINKAFTEKKAMVIDMIKDKISIDFISKYSNLSKEDIRRIANDNNLVIFPK